jgi:hypothetical protein
LEGKMSKCLRCGSDVKPHVVGGNSDRVRKREGVSEAMKRITDKMRLDWVQQMNASITPMFNDPGFHCNAPGTQQWLAGMTVRQAIDAAIRAGRVKK